MMAKRFRWGIFLLLILITLGGGTAIGMLTDPAAAYGEFIQPHLSPPNWVFPVVWSVFLNFSWTPVFFGLKQPLAAFVVLRLLIMVTVIVLVSYYKIRLAAGYLLLPYLTWLIFAGYLNFGIYLLNR